MKRKAKNPNDIIRDVSVFFVLFFFCFVFFSFYE